MNFQVPFVCEKITNVVCKIKDIRSLFEESEQVWKCTERIKRV